MNEQKAIAAAYEKALHLVIEVFALAERGKDSDASLRLLGSIKKSATAMSFYIAKSGAGYPDKKSVEFLEIARFCGDELSLLLDLAGVEKAVSGPELDSLEIKLREARASAQRLIRNAGEGYE